MDSGFIIEGATQTQMERLRSIFQTAAKESGLHHNFRPSSTGEVSVLVDPVEHNQFNLMCFCRLAMAGIIKEFVSGKLDPEVQLVSERGDIKFHFDPRFARLQR